MNIYLYYPSESETVTFAAAELAAHLKKTNSGFTFIHNENTVPGDNRFPKIFLKVTTSSDDMQDSYSVSLDSGDGFISGSNERSVLLAVYAVLRKIGFRFLMPGKTFIPESVTLADLSFTFSHCASLRHRGVCIEGADSAENVLDFIDWLPKLGFNSFFLQFREPYIFLERWYHHTFNAVREPESLSEDFLASCYRKMYDAMEKRSLLCHAFGHGWTCETIGLPSIGWVPETEEPSEDRRRMLALINGKREYIDCIPLNTNLCYSEPDVINRFCETVVSYAQTHPTVDYLHIWLADEPNHICECSECMKTTPTDQYIHLLNEIDRRLSEKNLDCKLVFLLYQELLYPPKKERLLNPERFSLMFAPISRTFKESYPDRITSVPLPEYKRNEMTLPVTINENLTYLLKWQEVFSGDSFVYDYPLGRAHYGDFGYISISRVLAGDLKNVTALGLNGYMSCQELRAFLPNSLPNYVMGYIALDTDENFEDLMKEYFSAAYGENYKEAADYLTMVSDLSDCDYFNRIGPRKNETLSVQYQKLYDNTKKFQTVLSENIEKRKQAGSSNDALHLFFWQLLAYHAQYVMRLCRALISLSSGDTESANKNFMDFTCFISENEPEMQPYLDVYRIIDVATKFTGFSLKKPDPSLR